MSLNVPLVKCQRQLKTRISCKKGFFWRQKLRLVENDVTAKRTFHAFIDSTKVQVTKTILLIFTIPVLRKSKWCFLLKD
jgi:hypothetical protein